MFGGGTQRGTFGAAAHRAADVAHRDTFVTSRNCKFGYCGQTLLHGIYRLLEILCGLSRQWGNLTFAAVAYSQQRLHGHQLRFDAAQLGDTPRKSITSRKLVGQQSSKCRQFIDRTVCLDANVALRHTLAAYERRRSLIAALGVNFHNLNRCFGR